MIDVMSLYAWGLAGPVLQPLNPLQNFGKLGVFRRDLYAPR